jgi:hypothetical protein
MIAASRLLCDPLTACWCVKSVEVQRIPDESSAKREYRLAGCVNWYQQQRHALAETARLVLMRYARTRHVVGLRSKAVPKGSIMPSIDIVLGGQR